MTAFAKKMVKGILGATVYPVLMPGAIRKTREARADSVEGWTDYALNFKYGLPVKGLFVHFVPGQLRSEIIGLLKVLEPVKPKVICEIGSAAGGTLFLFSRVAASDAKLISIDLPWGAFGEGYLPAQVPLFKSFARGGQQVHLLRGDSHTKQTFENIKSILSGDKIDFLFIDGDHSYEGVKSDFVTYSGLVKEGGLIAFHDIVPGPPQRTGGVHMFWEEIKGRYECKEYVDNWKQGGFGIGLMVWESK